MTPGRLIKKIFSLSVSAFAVLIISGFLSLHPITPSTGGAINEQANVMQSSDSFVQASNNNTESSLSKNKNSPLESLYRLIRIYLKDLF